ncbi:peptide-methionine (S)-S-oxide reductase MsrA, partial [Sphingomonas sp.]|uniref:peptide-methionine (S)-S-oxide reductase MsrA n=1 Tax=Sphingomonas sp. TaxID=28214 RepID=UPI0039C8C562
GTAGIAAESAVRAPAAIVSVPNSATSETAVFAGGCFWGVQGVFQHVKGVKSAVSGFTGGAGNTAHYDRVSDGDTGHAESVRVVFDPRVVSYADLLRIYFSVITDPTQLNAQGPDTGTQYRSALFPTSEVQRKVAAAYIDQLRQAHLWNKPIVTRIERAQPFYPAEAYHQDYLTLHPDAGYIRYNDLPKVAALKQLYPQLWREKPVLVNG